MPIRTVRLERPPAERLERALAELRDRSCDYPGQDRWTGDAIAALPARLRGIVAEENDRAVALLLLTPGFLEPWGTPTALLGGNPILPETDDAARLHAVLLSEASAWVAEEELSGFEVLLPMGEANMTRDDCLDVFHEGLGLERFYYTMTRALEVLPDCPEPDDRFEFVPAAAIPQDELFENYADCAARGEIELVAKQSSGERRDYFNSLLEDTLGHPGSEALLIGDRLVGFTLVASISETAAHLAWIGVAPDRQGEGLGRQLLCQAMARCRESRIERMSLYTDTTVAAQTLYGRLGFERAGTLTYRWRRPVD